MTDCLLLAVDDQTDPANLFARINEQVAVLALLADGEVEDETRNEALAVVSEFLQLRDRIQHYN